MGDSATYSVYLVTNMISGKQYAGQSLTVAKRWTGHKREARNGSRLRFHQAIKSYGPENFRVVVLRENLTKEEADYEESLAIRTLNLTDTEFGYNLMSGGSNPRPNEETRQRMSESAPRRRHDLHTEEIIALYRGGMSMTQIGEKLGTGYRTVGKRLLAAKEPIRPMSETLVLRFGIGLDDEAVSTLYRDGMNSSEIAEQFGVDPVTVRVRLRKNGSPVRSKSEAQTLRRGIGMDNAAIARLYREGMSTTQIGKRLGISAPAVRYRLKQVGQPRRTISQASLLRHSKAPQNS